MTVQHQVIEALTLLWGSALDVGVYDGPSLSADGVGCFVMVGYDPIARDGEAAAAQQEYVNIGGGHRKNEAGTVRVTVAAWSGDSSTTTRRQKVAGLLADAEAALRADLSLGGLVLWSGVTRTDLNQFLTEQGNQVYARFDVAYTARI